MICKRSLVQSSLKSVQVRLKDSSHFSERLEYPIKSEGTEVNLSRWQPRVTRKFQVETFELWFKKQLTSVTTSEFKVSALLGSLSIFKDFRKRLKMLEDAGG